MRIRKLLILILVMVISFTNIRNVSAASYSTSDFRSWSQSQSGYDGIKEVGCWIVAMSKLIYETGVDRSSSFNPDVYAEWEDKRDLVPNLNPDDYGNINLLQRDGEHAPEIYAKEKGKSLNYLGTWGADDNQLWVNIQLGYYTIIQVNNGGHYVYLNNEVSKQRNELWVDDSAYDAVVGTRPLSIYGVRNVGYVYNTDGSNLADTEAPVVLDAMVDIDSMTSTSYKVRAKATDNVSVSKVRFATWTLKENASGEPQDDLKWNDGVYNSNTGYWEYTVNASDHNNEIGIYRTHAYAYDARGNRSTSYMMQYIPMGSVVNNNLGNDFYARIGMKGLGDESWIAGLTSTSGSSIRLALRKNDYNDISQIWHFKKNGDNTYSIVNLKTNLTLDVEGGRNQTGRYFLAFTSNGGDNQKFYLMNYNGGIRIVPKMSGDVKGMDLKGAQLVDGANFELYESKTLDKANHTFSLLKVATNMNVSEDTIEIYTGKNKELSVSLEPNDVYYKKVKWLSNNENVATVDANGVVTGVTSGEAIITATTMDGIAVSKTIKVIVNELKGLITIDGKTYYYDNDGKIVKGKFVTVDGKIYYFGASSGVLQKSGWYTRSDNKYYLDKNTGEVYVGFKDIDNNKYYFNNKGVMQTGLVTVDGKSYYFAKNGKMVFGLVTINNKSYFFDSNGVMVKGEFATVDGKIYYFGASSGVLQKSGWYTRGGNKYYLDKNTGEVYVGLKDIDNQKYYFSDKGIMQKGLVTINGKEYYFNSDGYMVKGEFVTVNGKIYYFGASSGTLQKSGWYTRGGNKYYLDKNTGEVYIGIKSIDGNKYYFNNKGVMKKGLVTVSGNGYYFDQDGKMVMGKFITIDGKIYYFGASSGVLQRCGWYTRSGNRYYLDKNTGEVYTGTHTIDGIVYQFDKKGVLKNN